MAFVTYANWAFRNTSQRGTTKKWATSAQIGNITPGVWGVPNALERGTKSKLAHKCQLEGLLRSHMGTKLDGAHQWAYWSHDPCRLGGPQHFTAEVKIRRCPKVGGLGYITFFYFLLPAPHKFEVQSLAMNKGEALIGRLPSISLAAVTITTGFMQVMHVHQGRLWTPVGGLGYITPIVWEIPNAAHKRADGLRSLCHLRSPQHCTFGEKIESGPPLGGLAT